MSWLDVVVLGLAAAFAVSGFRQGFLTAALSFLGFFGGAVLGAQVSDPVASRFAADSSWRVAAAVAVVLGFALGGQVVAVWIGRALRSRLTWRPAQRVDAVLGALVSAVAVLLVVWMVATPLAAAPYPRLSSAVRDSQLVRAIDEVVPRPVRTLYSSLRDVVRAYDFPEVFGPLVPTRVRDVPAPDQRLANSAVVERAKPSVLKITGVAGSCARRVEGSGFVYAPDRVMTNAHVVAGVSRPQVEVAGEQRPATVVLYDSAKDVAVLRVPGLGLRALPFATEEADTNDDAIVVGYPENGPFFVGAGPDPGPAADPRPGHLRRPHRRPRGLLDLRRRPQRQLRRPAARPERQRLRGDLRRRDRPAADRLRAHRGRGRGRRERRPDRHRGGPDRRLRLSPQARDV